MLCWTYCPQGSWRLCQCSNGCKCWLKQKHYFGDAQPKTFTLHAVKTCLFIYRIQGCKTAEMRSVAWIYLIPPPQNLSSSWKCSVRSKLGGSGTARRSSTLLLICLCLFIADVPPKSAGLCVSQATERWGCVRVFPSPTCPQCVT